MRGGFSLFNSHARPLKAIGKRVGFNGFFQKPEFVLLSVVGLLPFNLLAKGDRFSIFGPGMNEDVNMEVIRVVMKAIRKPQRIPAMIPIRKISKRPLHDRLQNGIGTKALGFQGVGHFF